MSYSIDDIHWNSTIQVDLESLNTTDNPPTNGITYKNFTEYKIAIFLNTYYLACLCPIGLILNSAAIMTMFRLKPFNTSSLYVIILAAFDSLTLVAKLLFVELTRNDVDIGDSGCKILCFLGGFLDQFSVWILVLLTIERFVAVWLPLKVSCWFTMFRARLALTVTAVALMFINLPILFLSYQVDLPHPQGKECGFYPKYEFFGNTIWYWVESCLSAIFPCIALAVLNSLIIHRMRRSMEKQKQMISGSDNPGTTKQNHKTHLTVMLVTISVAFVTLVLPLAVYNVLRGSWDFRKSHRETARYFFTGELTHFLADCNHGMNFIFYFLSSRRFRRMFFLAIRCRGSPQVYGGATRTSYLKSTTSTTNTYYMHTSMRANGGI